jgi:putative ABC transport system ATP-binding protein
MASDLAADCAAIKFEAVSFSYGEVPVLADAGFALASSEVAYLVGRSGSGKSTLLRLAHGQLRPRAGRVTVDGVALHAAGERTVQRLRRRVAMVFQDGRLLPRLTALENVAYALRVADLCLDGGQARRRALAALRDVGLDDRLSAFPRQLSAGQRQRLATARAVAGGRRGCSPTSPPRASTTPRRGRPGPVRAPRPLGHGGAAGDLRQRPGGGRRRRGGRVLRLAEGALEEDRAEEDERCVAS